MIRKLILLSLALPTVAVASPQQAIQAVAVPSALKPGANESLAMVVPAKGVQIYECRAKGDSAGGYAWAFVAPEADLFDANAHRIGRHYAGPVWESADGSKIAGTVKEQADAPRANAIPWLLLAAKSVGPLGSFSGITSVQRVNTVGGTAPQGGCTESTAGTTARIPYTADYYFLAESYYFPRRFKAPQGAPEEPIAQF